MQCGGDPPAPRILSFPSIPIGARTLEAPLRPATGFSVLLLLSPTLSLQWLLFFLAAARAGSLGPGMTRRLQYI